MKLLKDGYVLKLVPRYAAFSLVFAFLWNSLIYNGAIALQHGRPALPAVVQSVQLCVRIGSLCLYPISQAALHSRRAGRAGVGGSVLVPCHTHPTLSPDRTSFHSVRQTEVTCIYGTILLQ